MIPRVHVTEIACLSNVGVRFQAAMHSHGHFPPPPPWYPTVAPPPAVVPAMTLGGVPWGSLGVPARVEPGAIVQGGCEKSAADSLQHEWAWICPLGRTWDVGGSQNRVMTSLDLTMATGLHHVASAAMSSLAQVLKHQATAVGLEPTLAPGASALDHLAKQSCTECEVVRLCVLQLPQGGSGDVV